MKRKMLAIITAALCFAAAIPTSTVLADGQKVVTLGADLTEDQKQAILRYFGVAGQNLLTLTITNQDERDHLGSYVPLEQIGTRTYSCALVNPTNSGGIQVKTANLSWVTSNMIASTLSTSGVVNCEVLAAAPFEVSGTGALTGILMAYESAVGATLDSSKKEVATQELITTTQIANTVGQAQATEIVNESKMQVIQGNVVNQNEIEVIVNEVAAEENISLSDEDRELLTQLLQEIAEQDYNYEEMKETLERVEENMQAITQQTEAAPEDSSDDVSEDLVVDGGSSFVEDDELTDVYEIETEALAEDSILMNTDDSALGESVIFDATDDAAIAETDASAAEEDYTDVFEIVSGDSYSEDTSVDVTDITDTSEDVLADVPVIEDDYADDYTGADNYSDVADDVYVIETEAPAEAAAEVPAETEIAAEDPGVVTLNLELIPLSEFEFAPITSESTAYEVYDAGINELTVYFQRDDIITGSGSLMLYNAADSSLIETIAMTDTTKATVQPMTDEELLDHGWNVGNKTVIKLAAPLAQNSTYFVILSEDALSTADGIGHSEAIADSFTWMIQTGEYGFALDKPVEGVTAGSTVSGQIMMDGTETTYACIENADPAMVTFDIGEFNASGTLNATFLQAGTVSFSVSFYDAYSTLLNTIEYEVVVK